MKKLYSLIAIFTFLICGTGLSQDSSIYNLADQSTFTNTGVQNDPVTSTTSPDGKLRTQAATTLWHSSNYGVVFKNGNMLEIDVAGPETTIRFLGSIYSAGTMSGGTTQNGSELGTANVDLDAYEGMSDRTGYYEFTYVGSPRTLYFTFDGANAYTPSIQVINAETTVVPTDVWDFGAEQLDPVLYNNLLTEEVINDFYPGVTAGTAGVNILSFTAGDLGYVTNGTNDRLRTTNTALTRWDSNIASSPNFTGRLYVNTAGSPDRYLSLNLAEDDEVVINARTDSGGIFNFEYAQDPALQLDQVDIAAAETELVFVAKYAGEYRIYDSAGKPSFFRVYRKAANYITIVGTVDETQAMNIPSGYSVQFTNPAGKIVSAVVSNAGFTVDLPVDITYEVSLADANGYIVTSGKILTVTEATTSHSITVLQVELFEVTGSISGLSDLSNLGLQFTSDPAANTIYNPIVSINETNGTYSVDLEANIEYTISGTGVNDYEIVDNTLTITAQNSTRGIEFSLKPVYVINVSTPDLDTQQRNDLELTFNNLDEDGYSYSFSDLSAIALRDGTYSISYDGLDNYPVELALTSNLTVSGAAKDKTLTFKPVTKWAFNERSISSATAYKGLLFEGSINVRGSNGDLNAGTNSKISIPVSPNSKIIIKDYYQSNYTVNMGDPVINSSNSTSTSVTTEYVYEGSTDGFVVIDVLGTTYFRSFEVLTIVPFKSEITVGVDKDYQTINEALDAITRMDRPNNELVTVMIDPGNYEEMLVIDMDNVTLKNASSSPSIGLLDKGVNIDPTAVRITSYYGQKYNFFSQGLDNKYDAETLAVNKENGFTDYVNKEGTGGGSSYWNATVVIMAKDVTIENIILENSFNQYISLRESQDVVQAKASSEPTRPTDYGNTSVQNRAAGYVTQAAAIGIAGSADRVILNGTRVVGRQDSFYGAAGARVAIYKGAMMGAVDYLFGGMTAVFYQTDLVLNTSDASSDASYITAAQQTSGRGFLMYECNVKSPIPGVETASTNSSKPGFFGRPWAPNTSEVVFYNTTIDESTFPGAEGQSLISPVGWTNTLAGESNKMYEFGTIENASGVDNSNSRVAWSTVLSTPTLNDGTEINTFNFTKGTDDWDPFATLNVETIQSNNVFQVSVKAYSHQLFVENVSMPTTISIYNLAGALIQTFDTDVDTSVQIKDGLYIVSAENYQGRKAFKVIAH
ncbi:pectinesterase family protein [Nonlabens sp. YIK11]|uniref:pectinesterase family protein n=1 Tax=Nonlabens sp. YIK11 TaxID=1453349 RepID=UPI0006DC3F86|nr:pectinesterase family protein [Nonlabens sp. YIK11]